VSDGFDLQPGEQIRWSGSPQRARLDDAVNYRRLLRAATPLCVGLLISLEPDYRVGGRLLAIFGLLCVVLAVSLDLGSWRRLRSARYAVTDRRVLAVYDQPEGEVVAAELATLGPPLVHIEYDGTGNIAFDRSPMLRSARRHWPKGTAARRSRAPFLYRLADAPAVGRLVDDAQDRLAAEQSGVGDQIINSQSECP
jgi:hypothetical protein